MPTKYLYWQLIRKFPAEIWLCIILFAFESGFAFLNIATFALLADMLIDKPIDQWMQITVWTNAVFINWGIQLNIYTAALVVWLSMTLLSIATVTVNAGSQVLRARVVQSLVREVFSINFDAGWTHLRNIKPNELLNTILNETKRVGYSISTLAQFVSVVLRFIAFVAVPAMLAPKLMLTVSAICLICLTPFIYLGRFTARQGKLNIAAQNKFVGAVKSSLDGARDIIGFGKESTILQRVLSIHKVMMSSTIKGSVIGLAASQFFEPIGFAVLLITIWFSDGHLLGLATLGTVMWGMFRAIAPLKQAIALRHQLDMSAASLHQVYRHIEISNNRAPQHGLQITPELKQEILIDNVSLNFEQAEILHQISIKISIGSKVALVGESGCGKSTVVDVLMGLLTPTSGHIYVDGIKLRDLTRESYVKRVTMVSQNTFLFDTSIRENLLWANPSATDSDMICACKNVCIHDFILSCPNQYDTLLGSNGYRLSGGQAQRLSIARALLCNPDLLILDEATSSIDRKTESSIAGNLDIILNNKALLVVTHNTASVKDASMIYVMSKGRIVEQGKFNELLTNEIWFAKLHKSQN